MKKLCHGVLLFSLLLFFSISARSEVDDAQSLIAKYRSSLVQVKLINKSSGDKESIGTGFFINEKGLIATNFHVVSGKVHNYDLYELEVELSSGKKVNAGLVDIDVINDLALVKSNVESKSYFKLATKSPEKGSRLYSLGNPHDLGMLVVPGTYNGFVKGNFIRKINFTGSINAGMSGGPVINSEGAVVGINVASAGNQLGFLVPVESLIKLREQPKKQNSKNEKYFQETIEKQLTDYQNSFFNDVLNNPWKKENLAGVLAPSEIRPYVKCWGSSNQKDKEIDKQLYEHFRRQCNVNTRFFISSDFSTGMMELYFTKTATSELGEIRFYNLLTSDFSSYRTPVRATHEYAGEFSCTEDIVKLESKSKLVFCVRKLKKYKSLFDVVFVGVNVQNKKDSLVSHFTLSAVSKVNTEKFLKRFIEEVKWK